MNISQQKANESPLKQIWTEKGRQFSLGFHFPITKRLFWRLL